MCTSKIISIISREMSRLTAYREHLYFFLLCLSILPGYRLDNPSKRKCHKTEECQDRLCAIIWLIENYLGDE